MAGFRPPDQTETVKPRGLAAPVVIAGKVMTDPGIIYTGADALLFATTNTVGFVACLGAVGVAATLKALTVTKPAFLSKHATLASIAYDDRTPLRAGALALLVVGGAAVSGGAMLPAAASFFLAAANFAMAESVTRQDHSKPEIGVKKEKPRPTTAELLFKRPDLYLNAGFACAGLMAGGAALFILPAVATAFGLGMRNAIQGRPEHEGHPKMITAGAAFAFAGIGFANHHGLIAAAHAVNAAVLVEFERRVTPGGMWQIAKDMASTTGRALGLHKVKEHAFAPRPGLAIEPPSSRLSVLKARQFFSRSAQPHAECGLQPQPSIPPAANIHKPEQKRYALK